MSATPGRKIAFDVLLRVEAGGAYASRALDGALAPHSRRAIDALDPAARVALRLGAYQLLHLGTPAHAAVGETVALAKGFDHGRAAGYVNAVLRALSRAPAPPPPPPLASDPAGHVATAEALPRWIADEWVAWLGPEEAL